MGPGPTFFHLCCGPSSRRQVGEVLRLGSWLGAQWGWTFAKGLPCMGCDLGVSSPNWSSCGGAAASLVLPGPHPQTYPRGMESSGWGTWSSLVTASRS